MAQNFPNADDIDLTLPGSTSVAVAHNRYRGRSKAAEFTSGGVIHQMGVVTDFRIEQDDSGSDKLVATWVHDEEIDMSSDVAFDIPTLTLNDDSMDLTIAHRGQTLLLPLFF